MIPVERIDTSHPFIPYHERSAQQPLRQAKDEVIKAAWFSNKGAGFI